MTRFQRVPHLLAFPLAVALAGCGATASEPWERTDGGIVVHPLAEGAADVRLQVVSDDIIRVTAAPDGKFDRSASLMRVEATGAAPKFEVTSEEGKVRISAPGVSAVVDVGDGRVSFFDADGKPLLSEVAGGRTFTPEKFDGKDYFSIRQRFESPADEAYYGTGLHQQGWMDLKGRDIELLQHNIDNGIPFLVSSRNYGILWDNNAITRYGDPRGLRQIGESLVLFDKDGKEGGLTATYAIDGDVKLARDEGEINYQYIVNLGNFPDAGKNMAVGGRSTVTWEGEVAAKTDGRHTFSLYNSEYAKLYIDGKLVLDRWRQNWNPWHHEFALDLKAGQRHKLRLEWDRIEPAYIALLARDPLPAAEAKDLSIWSEAAQTIDYYVVAGANADAVIAGYRTLTGKAVMLPKWAYGFWQSRERYKTQQELTDVVDEYRRRGLPLDNIVLDWSYWPQDAWARTTSTRCTSPIPTAWSSTSTTSTRRS